MGSIALVSNPTYVDLPFLFHSLACLESVFAPFGLSRAGTSLPTADPAQFGPSSTFRSRGYAEAALFTSDHAHLDVPSLLRSFACLDNAMFVSDFVHVRSSFAFRSFTRAEFVLSTFGMARSALTPSATDFVHTDPGPSPQSLVCLNPSALVLDCLHSGLPLPLQNPARLDIAFISFGLARIELSLFAVNLVHSGLVLSARSHAQLGTVPLVPNPAHVGSPLLLRFHTRPNTVTLALNLVHVRSRLCTKWWGVDWVPRQAPVCLAVGRFATAGLRACLAPVLGCQA